MREPVQAARWTEAERTHNETRELLQRAICEQYAATDDRWVWIRDLTDAWVVYEVEGNGVGIGLFRLDFTIADDGAVTLGTPAEVEGRTEYVPIMQATEAVSASAIDRIAGRVLESRGSTADGGRVFAMQIIDFGASKNGRNYPADVMTAAARLYEGAKAFDHHRSMEELSTSTIDGLAGTWRNVEANLSGLQGELHLLPSATHVAEALDASLTQQSAGLPPLVGASHDVLALYKPVTVTGGRRLMEATSILKVNSVDVVADPSAGGRATRMVAGGPGNLNDPLGGTMNLEQLLVALRSATPEARTELLTEHASVLTGAGITAEQALGLITETGGTTAPGTEIVETTELVTTESYDRGSLTGRMLIREAVASAGIAIGDAEIAQFVTVVTTGLPERFTEAQLTAHVAGLGTMRRTLEAANLSPTVPAIEVGEEHRDKVIKRIDATLERRWQEGYTSYVEMFEDFTGGRVARHPSDAAHQIVRESWAPSRIAGTRLTEATIDTSTFGEALGDAITRRLIAIYREPNWQTWRSIASISPVKDFRTQRRDRIGGFGDLETVLEKGTYQELTDVTDEEATYAIAKKGGVKGITFETVTNDDIEALVRVPEEMGRSARRTLHRFVWLTMFSSNPTCTYDSVALFHASHSNTSAVALGHAGLNSLRQLMRDQPGYGVASRPLGFVPKLLVVPNELEELAFELTMGDKAVPATTPGASDVPNMHRGMSYEVVDDLTDANDWYAVADKGELALMEIGFLGGREEPELFMQDDARVGAVFSADEVTWKIRHIYGGTILDHRAAQRGTQ